MVVVVGVVVALVESPELEDAAADVVEVVDVGEVVVDVAPVVDVVPVLAVLVECRGSRATVRPMPAAATVAVTPMATVARRMRTRASSRDRVACRRESSWG